MSRRTGGRRGFTLTELLLAMVLAGIIGVALTRLVISQARFVGVQDAMRRARSGSRAALGVMRYELRQVTEGGLVHATPDSVTLRVPYAFALSCGKASGTNTVVLSLLPPDSAFYANAGTSGYAYRGSTGDYVFVEPATRVFISNATCYSITPAVRVLYSPGGLAWQVGVTPDSGGNPVAGTAMYLYYRVRYVFAASVELPGRTALWRHDLALDTREEIVTPFDTAAGFAFLVGPSAQVRTTAPAVLDSVVGLRLTLTAASESTPQGRSVPMTFPMVTDLFFRNAE